VCQLLHAYNTYCNTFPAIFLQAIELELDEEEDGPVYQWFYEHQPLKHTSFVNGPSYRRWKLPLPIMAVLYRLAGQLLSDFVDRWGRAAGSTLEAAAAHHGSAVQAGGAGLRAVNGRQLMRKRFMWMLVLCAWAVRAGRADGPQLVGRQWLWQLCSANERV
jgi:hypothetical protein